VTTSLGSADSTSVPVISADGQYVAYNYGSSVYLKRSDNSGTPISFTGSSPAISYTGKRVAYVDGADVKVYNRTSGVEKTVAGSDPAISADSDADKDGKYLAYVAGGHVKVFNFANLITRDFGTGTNPSVSADGNTVSLEEGGVIYVATNEAPTATPQSVTTAEDTAKGITLAGTDPESDTLTYTVATQPTHGDLSGTAPNLTYTPDENYNGSDSFTFTVNDGTVDSTAATVSITITPVNDRPVATPQSVTTDEDTAKAITLAGTDVDDGDTLTYTVATQPTHGDLTGDAPDLTYTPDENYHGPDSFTFTVNDGTVDSTAATVSITVTSVNDPPVASNGTLTVNEDSTDNPGTLSATDVDGDGLTYSIVTNAGHGTATVTNETTGAYKYTPNADYSGDDSFTFKVNDGTADSNIATISITVTALPRPWTITPSAGAHGSIAPNTPQSAKTHQNMAFTATPDIGYTVDKWYVDDVLAQTGGTGFTLLDITASHAVHVTFKVQTFTVDASAGAGGSITPSGASTVNYGGYLFLQATPSTGYGVDVWKVDSTTVQTGGLSYELNNVTQNHTVEVTFVAYPAPTLTSITPDSHENTGKLSVTNLAGTGFRTGVTVQLKKSGQPSITATNVQVVSDTQITCDFNFMSNAAGAWDVVVTNDDGKFATLAGGVTLTLAPPTIVSITPNSGVNTGTVAITNLAGSGFFNPTVKLHRGDTVFYMTGVTLLGPTMITGSFDLTGAAVGAWDVLVTNGDSQSATLTNGFTVAAEPAPAPTSVSPTSVQKPGTKTITVNGSNFTNDATVTLTKSGETDRTLAMTSRTATKLIGTVDISAMAVGQWNVVVKNHPGAGNEQSATLTNALAITAAALTSVTLTTDKAWPQPTGATITLTANKAGTATDVQYQFWARILNQTTSQSEYILLRDYQTDNTYAWKPTTNNSYWLYVYAREVGSSEAYQVASPEVYFKIEVGTLTGVTISSTSPNSSQTVGNPVTITASKTGTAVDVEYSFTYKWYNPVRKYWEDYYIRGYNTNNQCIWTPTVTGQYRLYVMARIVGSSAVFDRMSPYKAYTINP